MASLGSSLLSFTFFASTIYTSVSSYLYVSNTRMFWFLELRHWSIIRHHSFTARLRFMVDSGLRSRPMKRVLERA